MTGMRRVRTVVAFALLAMLTGVWIATLRIDHEAVGSPGVQVEYMQVGRGRVRAAYLNAIGPLASTTHTSGGVRCAHGAPDERAWSRPAHPLRAVGRFACRSENGRAAMWWFETDRGRLAHAVGSDGDVASLFAWWLSHSER